MLVRVRAPNLGMQEDGRAREPIQVSLTATTPARRPNPDQHRVQGQREQKACERGVEPPPSRRERRAFRNPPRASPPPRPGTQPPPAHPHPSPPPPPLPPQPLRPRAYP